MNPSTLTSKSLTQSRYLPELSGYKKDLIRPHRSRWANDLKAKNEDYDFNMFSNYINSTFQVPSRSTQDSYAQARPSRLSNQNYERMANTDSLRPKLQEQPVMASPYFKRRPLMTESKYMRSSSANNVQPLHTAAKTSPIYRGIQSNAPTYTGTKTYRIVKGAPANDVMPSVYQREVPRENAYLGGGGEGLSHVITARVPKSTVRYAGGTRQDLVQSMYREKPSNLLQMKYGNSIGMANRY